MLGNCVYVKLMNCQKVSAISVNIPYFFVMTNDTVFKSGKPAIIRISTKSENISNTLIENEICNMHVQIMYF